MNDLVFTFAMSVGALGLAASSPGCTGSAQVHSEVAVDQPHLVWAQPGIWVMTDSEWPVFYHDGYYWLYQDGAWFNSTYYWGGWGYMPPPRVPRRVATIGNPQRYRNYRSRPKQRRKPAPVPSQYRERDHRSRRFQSPAARDHREAPATRDHREPSQSPSRRNEKVPSRRGHPR